MRNTVGLLPIGEKVELGVLRDGKKRNIKAAIGEPQAEKKDAEAMHKRLEGAVLGELEENHPLFGKVDGVIVVDINQGTPASISGLRKNDVITSVNRIRVKNLQDIEKAIGKNGNALLLNIRRGNGALFLLMQ